MTDFLNTYKTQPAELSVNEVAKILRCSNQMVFKLCLQYKDLSYYKVGNRYDLRHINVCERLQGNVISATETMVECNHSTLDQTLGYGYPSKKDEAKHLADITKQIPLFGEQKEVRCLQIPSFKYERLLDDPLTRIIPGYGICCSQNCKPQFEKCITCESFSPDPAYRDYFSAAIDLLIKRNQRIIKKHGDSKILKRNEEMIHLYQKCLDKIERNIS